MARGSTCPNCGKDKLHDKGSYLQCSSCGYIGWSWQQPVKSVGRGKGNTCPNCENQTLHIVFTLDPGYKVRRCKICDAIGIDPLPGDVAEKVKK